MYHSSLMLSEHNFMENKLKTHTVEEGGILLHTTNAHCYSSYHSWNQTSRPLRPTYKHTNNSCLQGFMVTDFKQLKALFLKHCWWHAKTILAHIFTCLSLSVCHESELLYDLQAGWISLLSRSITFKKPYREIVIVCESQAPYMCAHICTFVIS